MINSKIFSIKSLIGCVIVFCISSIVYGQDSETNTPEMLSPQEGLILNKQDSIDMGFTKNEKKYMTGAVSAINPENVLEFDNNQSIRALLNGRIAGMYGSSNVRGLGDAMVVIDGIPGRPLHFLNADEIEQVTVLKDANAVALYGAMGRNGVIVVTTKRGSSTYKRANVNVSYGMRDPVSYPNYLGSADYMQYYNEARLNDGLDSVFTQSQINDFRNSTNRYRYPNVDFYSDEYLKSFTDYTNALAEFSGGTENSQYYVNLGYTREGSLVKLNPEVNKGNNRFNVRGNVDFKVNDFINSSLDVVSIINSSKSGHSNHLWNATQRKPHLFAPLLPLSYIDTTGNEELKGMIDAANTFYGNLLGGAVAYQNNTPIAESLAGGYTEDMFRMTQVNNAIDIDLSSIVDGLSAKTYVSFDFYNLYSVSINNNYSIYEPTWSGDTIIALNRIGEQDRKDQEESVNTDAFFTRYGFYGMLNYDKQIDDKHGINASLIGFANNMHIRNSVQTNKNAHVALQARYNFDRKLMIDLSAAYVNSPKLPEGNRAKLSPSIGVGYLISEESFLENSEWLDYLKVKGSAGIIHSDIGIWDYFLYDEIYAQDGPWFGWADGRSSNGTIIEQGENNNLTFETRQDLNLGVEAILFDNVWLELNAFQTDIDNQVTLLRNQYPSFYTDFIPYGNYNKDRYRGVELGVNYFKDFGELKSDIGFNLMYVNSERLKVDEAYADDYQYRQGNPVDAMWGLEDMGFYSIADFDAEGNLNDGLPVPTFGDVQPGDIRYKDQNGDDVINQQDEVNIGRWRNPFVINANIRLEYKGFTLFMLGTGQYGSDRMLDGDYYWVDGNDKYSEVVLNRWTEETANTATYPRLSSQDNNNNFRNSTFWLINDSFFSLERAQLTYNLPSSLVNSLNMKYLSVFVSGSNLLEFAENKEERQLYIGGNPMYRTYSVGLRAKF